MVSLFISEQIFWTVIIMTLPDFKSFGGTLQM